MLTAALGDSVQSEQASTAAQLKEMASRQPAFDIVHVHGNPAFFCKLIEKADHNAMMCCPQSTQKTQNNSVNSVFSVDISSLFGKRSEKADHNVPLDLRSLATKGTQERSSFIVQRSTFNVQRLIITPHGHPLPRVPAYAVVARSPMEHDSLAKQHPHVETVRNPIITRTTTAATCAAQMMRIYQHVANSFLLPLLSPSSRQALATLLCVAIGGDARWAIQPLPTDADYHQLQAYARLEGVLPMVRKGLRLMAVEVPEPEEMDCYLPAGYKVPQRMQGGAARRQSRRGPSAAPARRAPATPPHGLAPAPTQPAAVAHRRLHALPTHRRPSLPTVEPTVSHPPVPSVEKSY